jgi:hypothetical protein
MIKITVLFNKKDGSVMVAALLVLVLLTIIGISAISISNTELNITANAQLHKMSFFISESGWHVMADWLDDQYPLPTVSLGSDNWMAYDSDDNDGDGTNNEHDENIDFTNTQFANGPANGTDDDDDGIVDEPDENCDWIPFSAARPDYRYRVTAEFTGAGIAPGWDPTAFVRYNYSVNSIGNVPARNGTAVSQITVTAGKIQEK